MGCHRFLSLVLAFVFWVSVATAADEATERIFFNASVFTAEPEHPYAEAVAIRADKIIAVGSRAEVAKSVGATAESIDLHGKWLLPGFIDSHIHTIFGGLNLVAADVGDKVESIADLVAFVDAAKKSGK